MLDKGVFAESSDENLNQATLQEIMSAVLLSILIPKAWSLSADVHPVVLVQPGGKNLTNPFEHILRMIPMDLTTAILVRISGPSHTTRLQPLDHSRPQYSLHVHCST
jgi:hypothetical protein